MAGAGRRHPTARDPLGRRAHNSDDPAHAEHAPGYRKPPRPLQARLAGAARLRQQAGHDLSHRHHRRRDRRPCPALLLARDGHEVTLIERFAQARPLGSGLVIQPVGLAVLDRIGAGDDARRLSSPIARTLGHAAGGRKALDVSYPAQAPGRGIHRAALFGLL